MPKTPRISGRALRVLARSLRASPVRDLVVKLVRKDLGVEQLRALAFELRSELPLDARPVRARASHERPSAGLASGPRTSAPRTGEQLRRALAERRVTSAELVERAYRGARALAARTPTLGPILVYDEQAAARDAAAADARIAAGRARGPLDGIPLVVKEELDVEGLSTNAGATWHTIAPSAADGVTAARLRAAGAVLLGHSPMTEHGMNPVGVSAQRRLPRNPHDVTRTAGGSSTGSAVAVATGIGTVAIGADGGGSIRIPAALNGVFGLKPTFGRVPRTGSAGGGTMTHHGPLAASMVDVARALDVLSGEDAGDPASVGVPAYAPGELEGALARGVRGLRIGVEEGEWSAAPEGIARAGREALRALEKEGATIVPVTIPLARFSPAIGYQTIGVEFFGSLLDARREHLDRLGPELQVFCAVIGGFESDDYVDAQRFRASLRAQVADVLREVDVLALPTTGTTAPRASDDDMSGFLDPPVLDAVGRYAYIGNLCGLPAGTAPVGRDGDGLPIGLQIVGDAFDEACVLQVLAHLERVEAARFEPPPVYVDLLG